MNHYVSMYADDLIQPRATTTPVRDGKHQIDLRNGSFAYVTAGEASQIANAWIELADELHEREVDRLQGLPSQDAITVPITVGEVAQTLDSI